MTTTTTPKVRLISPAVAAVVERDAHCLERLWTVCPHLRGVATITTAEAARLLGCSMQGLYEWRVADPPVGPAFVRLGRSVRYPLTGIALHLFGSEFVANGAVEPAPVAARETPSRARPEKAAPARRRRRAEAELASSLPHAEAGEAGD